MRFLFFKPTSNHLLLFVFLNLLWAATDGGITISTPNGITSSVDQVETTVTVTATAQPTSGSPLRMQNYNSQTDTTETAVTQPTTTPPPTPTPPLPVVAVTVKSWDETSITLQWTIVNNILTYKLTYNDIEKEINGTSGDSSIQYVVSDLTAGTKYSFTLFTVLNGINSTGYLFSAVTAPLNPANFSVAGQNESSITLEWTQVDGIQDYTLIVSGFDNNLTLSNELVSYVVSDLNSTSTYNFTLFTVFENAISSGTVLTAVTAPLDPKEFRQVGQNETSVTLQWTRVIGINNYILNVNGNESNVSLSESENIAHTITDLESANVYDVTLFTAFEYARSGGKQLFAVTAPRNPAQFKASGQNETSITLEWTKQDEIHSYILEYGENKINITPSKNLETTRVSALEGVSKSSEGTITTVTTPENPTELQSTTMVTRHRKQAKDIKEKEIHYNKKSTVTATERSISYTVGSLTHGAAYSFSLFAVFKNVNSSGTNITAFTVPPQVSSVTITGRNVTSATLMWKSPNKSWTYRVETNDTDDSVQPDDSDFVSFSVSGLSPGSYYLVFVTTVFSGLNSTVYKGFLVTQIKCEEIQWQVTTSSIQGAVGGLFTHTIASNISQTHVTHGGGNVSFTGLYPGATYEISLLYETPSENLSQCASNPKVTISPPWLIGSCNNWASGYSAQIVWNKPDGVLTKVQINMSGQSHSVDGNENQFIISGLQPAKTYEVSLVSFSGERSSGPFPFSCNTDNRGVIAGSVVGVLLFVLVCMALFIFLKRPDIIRGKKSFIAGVEKPATKRKVIPKASFPDHFSQLSADENRGFSEEYEALATVGTEQTRKAAILLENKSKNRFTNILPYDWSRVKLITSSPDDILDYINANYMPGYNRNREYIASQGPLPNTVKDFWRMIWEQRVKGIVMVTNCIESGRTKCERYWPEDQKPCLYGDLLVTLTSEQKESNWTLREFLLKDRNDSEERTVKHFHFTAWPDHGVPEGTQILIQFRGLVRRHIESDGTNSPTVVHCSAGVGRTGTIIALDVLLQQLEKERAVSINDFVHRMRQHRSHMVQTESQYVFLHQCIMDSLKRNEKQEENIYENSDLIYANATALREFHNHNT